MEMSKDMPPAEYPQSDNNFSMQDPSAYPPTQPYVPPPNYDAQQYPAVEPQSAAVQVVIQKQPAVVTSHYSSEAPQSFLRFSISTLILTVLCAWPLLICSIPALLFSIMSRDRAGRGEYETARTYSRLALILNILASISFVVIVIAIIVVEIAAN